MEVIKLIFEDGRVVGCGVVVTDFLGRILLGKRGDGQGWGLAGGKLDAGETHKEAAKRELFEEFGIHALNLTLIGTHTSDDIVISGKQRGVKSYLYFAESYFIPEDALQTNREIVRFEWFYAEDILKMNDIFPPTIKSIKLYLGKE